MIAPGYVTGLQSLRLQALAQTSVGSLLNTAAEGLAVAAVAWILLRLAGRQNSGTRFAVWFLALLAIAVLPFSLRPTSPVLSATSTHSGLTISASSAMYLFGLWAAVSAILLVRLAIGLFRMRELRRNCDPIDIVALHPEMADVLQRFDSHRRVELCISDRVNCPAAFGFLRPAIVFPTWAMRDLSVEELKVILLHELAHLRRWDDWTNLFQQIVKAILFFHPAVWWIENRLALEREMACDDVVLSHTANPRAYAASLVSFAEKVRHGRELSLVQAAAGRMRQISHRIAQILDASRPQATGVWKPVMGAVTVLSVAVVVAAPYAPRLVAFQKYAPTAQPVVTAIARTPQAALPTTVASVRPTLRPEQPRVIPGRLDTRLPVIPAKARNTRHRSVLLQASTRERSLRPDILVVTQSTEFTSGSAVTTFCIWRVNPGNPNQRQIEAEIVMSSI